MIVARGDNAVSIGISLECNLRQWCDRLKDGQRCRARHLLQRVKSQLGLDSDRIVLHLLNHLID